MATLSKVEMIPWEGKCIVVMSIKLWYRVQCMVVAIVVGFKACTLPYLFTGNLFFSFLILKELYSLSAMGQLCQPDMYNVVGYSLKWSFRKKLFSVENFLGCVYFTDQNRKISNMFSKKWMCSKNIYKILFRCSIEFKFHKIPHIMLKLIK